jgi:hypothetical protein
VIEEVAGDEQQVDLVRDRAIDDALEDVATALAIRGLLVGSSADVTVEVDVGRVEHAQGSSRGHGGQHATSRMG